MRGLESVMLGNCEEICMFVTYPRAGPHSIKMPAPLFHSSPAASYACHLRKRDKASC